MKAATRNQPLGFIVITRTFEHSFKDGPLNLNPLSLSDISSGRPRRIREDAGAITWNNKREGTAEIKAFIEDIVKPVNSSTRGSCGLTENELKELCLVNHQQARTGQAQDYPKLVSSESPFPRKRKGKNTDLRTALVRPKSNLMVHPSPRPPGRDPQLQPELPTLRLTGNIGVAPDIHGFAVVAL